MMCKKIAYLISVSVVALTCTSYADVVIGNFEGDFDNWVGVEGDTKMEIGTVGTTLGDYCLDFTLNNVNYFPIQWDLPEGLKLDLSNVTTLEIDVTMLVENFEGEVWTKVADKIAINSDLGWREVTLTEVINRDTGESTTVDWGTWSPDENRTVIVDIGAAGYDWTGLPDSDFVSIVISVMGEGLYHFDNIRLNGVYIEGLIPPQGQAKKPNPENGAEDILGNSLLIWKPGDFADTHTLYFGTNFNDVNEATIAEPLGVTVVEGLARDVNYFDPGMLEYGVTYYWRIDEVNSPGDDTVYKGTIWSFTAEAYADKIPAENIIATAISNSPNNDPNNTINESGLNSDDMDQHSNVTADMWISDGLDVNDVWIQYDFDRVYKLHQMLVWNYNDGAFLWRTGFKETTVEYSEDGQVWKVLPDVPEFAVASGKNDYEYNTVVDFNGIKAKSVRITGHSNWSDFITMPNYGLSEVRFMYIPVWAREPYPAIGANNVTVEETLSWRAGRGAVEHNVYLSTDEQAVIDGNAPLETVSQTSYPSILNAGRTYYWRVDEVNDLETWEGELWNFITEEFISIDDFDDYNDNDDIETGNAIFLTWIDGYPYPPTTDNGGQIGHSGIPYSEENIVYNGSQSAPFYYDNTTTADNSEIEQTFDTPQDLTIYGADMLRLYYYGNAVTFAEPSQGTIVMSGEGADIWGTADEFRYAYMELTGDGSIIARLDTLQQIHNFTKAGVMIRETLDTDSAMAASLMHASGGTVLQFRTEAGDRIEQVTGDMNEPPVWLKITRTGNTITSERSIDGVSWEPIDGGEEAVTVDITMSNTIYIGLIVCSHSTDVLATAAFSGVETAGNVNGSWSLAAVGDEDQAEGTNTLDNLYIALEDDIGNRFPIYAPLTAVGSGGWNEWLIPYDDFTGVNMSEIKKIAIGIGKPGDSLQGKGLIYLDNISYGHILE